MFWNRINPAIYTQNIVLFGNKPSEQAYILVGSRFRTKAIRGYLCPFVRIQKRIVAEVDDDIQLINVNEQYLFRPTESLVDLCVKRTHEENTGFDIAHIVGSFPENTAYRIISASLLNQYSDAHNASITAWRKRIFEQMVHFSQKYPADQIIARKTPSGSQIIPKWIRNQSLVTFRDSFIYRLPMGVSCGLP